MLVYLTALPFTPFDTLLFKEFANKNIPRIIYGYQKCWPLLLQQLRGHRDGCEVWSVAFSRDGHLIASGSSDKTVRIWDTVPGILICPPLEGHEGAVNSVEFSSDGTKIISGSEDNTVCLWDVKLGTLILGPLRGHSDAVRSVAFFPDGERFVSGSLDKSIQVWSVTSSRQPLLRLLGHDDGIQTVIVSPDGKCIVSGSGDKTIRTWDAKSGARNHLIVCQDSVRCLAFSGDGSRLVAGLNDGNIYIRDAPSTSDALPLYKSDGAVYSLAFSPDGARLVASSLNTIFVLDVNTGKEDMPPISVDGKVWSVGFSSDRNRIVSGSGDGVVRIWGVARPQVTFKSLGADNKDIRCLQFSPDGLRVISGSKNGTIYIQDSETGNVVLSLQGHTDCVNDIAFSHDGKFILTGSFDRMIHLWDAKTYVSIPVSFRRHKTRIQSHKDSVLSLGFSHDDKRIVSGSADKTIRVWDATSGRILLPPFQGHKRAIHRVQFSPDDKQILSGSSEDTMAIRLWDSSSGLALRIIQCPPYHGLSVTFLSDGSIKSCNDKNVITWDSDSGAEIPNSRTNNYLNRYCGLNEPIALTRKGWIVHTSTSCTISKLPPIVSVAKWTSSKTTVAFTTSLAELFIMHFPENLHRSPLHLEDRVS